VEIERKFLVARMPENLEQYPCRKIEQGYLCISPVVRVRRDNDNFWLTYKGGGMMARQEHEHPLDEGAYRHLLAKTDGTIISKKRYMIPLDKYTAELDVFEGVWEGLVIVEVEFPDLESARAFIPPEWMGEEVTYDGRYHNSWLSRHGREDM
jgi:CYTH domain-containing protein